MRGRWSRPMVIQHKGEHIPLLPTPIRAIRYMASIQWGRLGTVEQALAKQELARMLQIYERFAAMMTPIRQVDDRMVWEVRFPEGSKWQSGPERPSAFQAILDNYARNAKFRGYMMAEFVEGNVRNVDQIITTALRRDNAQAKEVVNAGTPG